MARDGLYPIFAGAKNRVWLKFYPIFAAAKHLNYTKGIE